MGIRLLIMSLVAVYWVGVVRAGRLHSPCRRIWTPIVLFLGLAGLSWATSSYSNQSAQWFVVLLGYAALLYLLESFIVRWEYVIKLLAVVVSMGVGEAVWALTQAYALGLTRPTGTFFNPNFLAGYLASVISVVVAYFCYLKWPPYGKWRKSRGDLISLVASVSIALMLFFAIVWTGSRGGTLAMLAGVAFVVGVRFGKKGLLGLCFLLFLGVIASNPIRDRAVTEHVGNPVAYARLQMWQSAFHEMADHPFGIGLGLYQYTYPRYAFPVEGEIIRYGKVAKTPHNEYLQMGVELGIASVAIFFWGVVLLAVEGRWLLRQRLRRWQRATLLGVGAGMLSILTQAAVDSNLHEPAIAILLTLFAGILMIGRRLVGNVSEPSHIRILQHRGLWVTVGGISLCLMTGQVLMLGLAYRVYESGSHRARQHDYQKAIEDLHLAVALDPGKTLYHSALAAVYYQLYQKTGDERSVESSLDELRTAISLNPLDGRLYGRLGSLYVSLAGAPGPEPLSDSQRSQFNLAVVAYKQAVALQPYWYSHRYELGLVYLALNELELGERSIWEAIDLEPNFLSGRERLARLYFQTGQLDAARDQYQQIVARRDRYTNHQKSPVEEYFLQVDVSKLANDLKLEKA